MNYAELLKANGGRGRIIRDPGKIFVTARLMAPTKNLYGVYTASEDTSPSEIYPGGLLPFNFILTSAGANQNNQFFVEDEIAQADVYNSVIGEPINEDHEQSFHAIVGEVRTSSFIQAAGGIPSSIKCSGCVFANQYPRVAYKVYLGAGRWAAISMEAIPQPLEQVGKYLVVHNPKFVGAALVRFPACPHAQIDPIGSSSKSQSAAILKAAVDKLLH